MQNTFFQDVDHLQILYSNTVEVIVGKVLLRMREEYQQFLLEIQREQKTTELDLLSPSETCKLFSPPIGRTTLYNYTKAGRLTSYRLGHKVFYSRKEVIQTFTTITRLKP